MNPRCAADIINAVRNPARPAGLLASDGRRQRRPKFSTPKNAACLAIHAQRSLSMFSADADALRVRALNVYQSWVSPTLGRSWHCQSTAAESEGPDASCYLENVSSLDRGADQVHNCRSSERYWMAWEMCSDVSRSDPARSAMVRATFKIRS